MLFGSSGIRQLYSHELLRLGPLVGAAVALGSRKVILGTDTRTSGPVLASAVLSGLLSGGAEVSFGSIAPTPAVAIAAGNADAGIMITASHNPECYNGYKLFRRDGSSFTLAEQEEIEELIAHPQYAEWSGQGSVVQTDLNTPHINGIVDEIGSFDKKMTVVADCGNGAGCMVTPFALEALDADVIKVNCTPNGVFSRPSEPLKENLLHIPELIAKNHADCAVVNDGDADRMMAFDNKGRYIDGDAMLALFADYLGAKTVVTTVDASMAIEDTGAHIIRTPVGDSFVSEKLIEEGEFGGEPSGAWVFPKHSLCPDGPYAAALLVKIASEMNLADAVDALPKYTILRDSIKSEYAKEIVKSLGAENPTNGIRVAAEDGWYLIRASGTEPKVRCTAEGKTKEIAKEMLRTGMDKIQKAERDIKCSA